MRINDVYIKIIAAVSIASCLSSCKKIETKTSLERMGLKGNVRIIREKEYEVYELNAEIQTRSQRLAKIEEFNKKGFTVKLSTYRSSGDLNDIETYEYNKNGLMTERRFDYGAFARMTSKIKYFYDENGQVIEEDWYNIEGMTKVLSGYDENGKLTSRKSYNSNGVLIRDLTHVTIADGEEFLNEKYLERDSHGNGLRILKLKGFEPKYLLVREIEYW